MSYINIKTIDDLVKKADIEINSNIANILRRLARLQNNIWESANYLQIAKNVEELDLPITEIPNIMVIKGMTPQIEEEIKEFISIGRIERLDITTKKDGPHELEIQYALLDKIASVDIEYSDDLSNNLTTMTEWEYKRHVVEQDSNMLPQRKENIIKTIDNEIKPVLDGITNSLLYVFKDWLGKHAILNPKKWAQNRYNYDEFEGDPKSVLESIKSEYIQYRFPNNFKATTSDSDFIEVFVENNLEYFQTFLNDIKQDFLNSSIEDLEYYKGLDREEDIINQQNTVNYYENLDLSNEQERLNFYRGVGSDIISIDYIIANPDFKEMCMNFMEKAIFPLWYDKWSSEGIEETRENIEETYNLLRKSKKLSFNDRIIIIHEALTTTHQTGDMTDYIGEYNEGVDNSFLNELSNIDQDTLNKWKQEILVG
jgi:hypothetical protein